MFDGVQQIRISHKALLVSGAVVKANKRSWMSWKKIKQQLFVLLHLTVVLYFLFLGFVTWVPGLPFQWKQNETKSQC